MLAYRTAQLVCAPWVRLLYRIRRVGHKQVPREGGVILVANHRSYIDPPALVVAAPRPPVFLAKAELFRHPMANWFFSGLGHQIPVDRKRGGNVEAIHRAAAHLRAGGVVGIFPEGTRSPDGRLGKGKPGVARIAFESGATVIPVAITGSEHKLPPKKKWVRMRVPMQVRFGPPVDLSDLTQGKIVRREDGKETTAERQATDRIMAAVAALLGQPYDAASAPEHYARPKGAVTAKARGRA